jgi:SAM-dependent methyltransferase
MTEAELKEQIARYTFYHIIKLTDTVSTPGVEVYVPAQELCMKYVRSLDLQGRRVLDIGCRDGLFSFAAERMGAGEVIGIDSDLSRGATELLIPYLNSKVRMHRMNIFDLSPESFGSFDVIIFPGVLYHLRYPFWALRIIRGVLRPGGHLVIETGIWEGEPNNAMLFCPTGSDSPYEPTSCTFFNMKGLTDTLESLGFQTLSTEMLPATPTRAPLRSSVMKFLRSVKTSWNNEPQPPIRHINRGVVFSKFVGVDKDDYFTQYWEKLHDSHTQGYV